jgi:hypothetical protein
MDTKKMNEIDNYKLYIEENKENIYEINLLEFGTKHIVSLRLKDFRDGLLYKTFGPVKYIDIIPFYNLLDSQSQRLVMEYFTKLEEDKSVKNTDDDTENEDTYNDTDDDTDDEDKRYESDMKKIERLRKKDRYSEEAFEIATKWMF